MTPVWSGLPSSPTSDCRPLTRVSEEYPPSGDCKQDTLLLSLRSLVHPPPPNYSVSTPSFTSSDPDSGHPSRYPWYDTSGGNGTSNTPLSLPQSRPHTLTDVSTTSFSPFFRSPAVSTFPHPSNLLPLLHRTCPEPQVHLQPPFPLPPKFLVRSRRPCGILEKGDDRRTTKTDLGKVKRWVY